MIACNSAGNTEAASLTTRNGDGNADNRYHGGADIMYKGSGADTLQQI